MVTADKGDDVIVTFYFNDDESKKRHECAVDEWNGGISGTYSGIPITVTDVRLNHFKMSMYHYRPPLWVSIGTTVTGSGGRISKQK